jgi:hypothetical protein
MVCACEDDSLELPKVPLPIPFDDIDELDSFEQERLILQQNLLEKEPYVTDFIETYFEALAPGENPDINDLFMRVHQVRMIYKDKKNVKLTPYQRQSTIQLRDTYKAQEIQYTKNAQGISIWIPEITTRNLCNNYFETALVMMSTATIQTKIIAEAIVQMKCYLCGVWDAWDNVNYNLQEAKKAALWHDYYQRIIENDDANFPPPPPKETKPKKDKKKKKEDK